ncbi:hypothetical protein F5X96DRAFT_665340 [Biscogniauxia mediterranea]|nr:hypothetical protein F5X96DRAFT_665340 [Biscogniauxia mediterranea]
MSGHLGRTAKLVCRLKLFQVLNIPLDGGSSHLELRREPSSWRLLSYTATQMFVDGGRALITVLLYATAPCPLFSERKQSRTAKLAGTQGLGPRRMLPNDLAAAAAVSSISPQQSGWFRLECVCVRDHPHGNHMGWAQGARARLWGGIGDRTASQRRGIIGQRRPNRRHDAFMPNAAPTQRPVMSPVYPYRNGQSVSTIRRLGFQSYSTLGNVPWSDWAPRK